MMAIILLLLSFFFEQHYCPLLQHYVSQVLKQVKQPYD